MSSKLFRRAVLAAVFGLSMSAGLARAQVTPLPLPGPVPTPTPAPMLVPMPAPMPSGQTILYQGMIYVNTGVPSPGLPGAPGAVIVPAVPTDIGYGPREFPVGPPERPLAALVSSHASPNVEHPILDTWKNLPKVGCWTNLTSPYSCSSLHTELVFIFGSCRNFNGEPCYKGAPLPYPGAVPEKNFCPNCR